VKRILAKYTVSLNRRQHTFQLLYKATNVTGYFDLAMKLVYCYGVHKASTNLFNCFAQDRTTYGSRELQQCRKCCNSLTSDI